MAGEGHVRGFDRCVGAGRAHRDADVCAREGGGIVDAIADHRHDLALRLQFIDLGGFLLRHDVDDGAEHAERRHDACADDESGGQLLLLLALLVVLVLLLQRLELRLERLHRPHRSDLLQRQRQDRDQDREREKDKKKQEQQTRFY